MVAPQSHPFLLRVSRSLLEKADRSRGEANVRLRLDEKVAPELYASVDEEELRLLEMLLSELEASGWVSLRIARRRDFQSFIERNPTLELLDFNELASWAAFQSRHLAWDRRFLAHLRATPEHVFGNARNQLLDYLSRSPLWALEALPLETAEACLVTLQDRCRGADGLALRELSAQVFQGRSKVLDNRYELLRILGASEGIFSEAPVQLLVAAPSNFEQVIFVENLVTFEHMADEVRQTWRNSLLVYASGFKGGARRLRSFAGSRLYFRGNSQTNVSSEAVRNWLYGAHEMPVFFFGDLDYSGMQILASLHEAFPNAQAWRPGYEVLASLLRNGGGHTPDSADKEGQTDPGVTDCLYADQALSPLMRQTGRFVDQEAARFDEIDDAG